MFQTYLVLSFVKALESAIFQATLAEKGVKIEHYLYETI